MDTMFTDRLRIKDLEETLANSTPLLAVVGAGDFAVEKIRAARGELVSRSASFDPKAFREQVYKFEHDIPYNPADIDFAYYGLINAFVDSNVAERPVFITAEIPEQVGKGYTRVPNHLLYRLASDSSYLPEKFPSYRFTPLPGRIDYYTAKMHQLYAASLFDRGAYEHANGRDSIAKRYYDYALGFDPGISRGDVPSLPLRSDGQVGGVIEFFERLRSAR